MMKLGIGAALATLTLLALDAQAAPGSMQPDQNATNQKPPEDGAPRPADTPPARDVPPDAQEIAPAPPEAQSPPPPADTPELLDPADENAEPNVDLPADFVPDDEEPASPPLPKVDPTSA